MWKYKLRLLFCSVICCAATAAAIPHTYTLDLRNIDPLEKILPNTYDPTPAPDTVCVARGEYVTLQILLNNPDSLALRGLKVHAEIPGIKSKARILWPTYVRCGFYADDPGRLQDESGKYPDLLLDAAPDSVCAGGRAVIWVDIPVPAGTDDGLYHGVVHVSDAAGHKGHVKFHVRVFDVLIPQKQTLTVCNWHYSEDMKAMNNGEKVLPGSKKYFKLLKTMAVEAAKYRQDCWCIVCRPKITGIAKDGGFEIDFTDFDREVNLLMRYGNLQRMTHGHFGGKDPETGEIKCDITYIENGQICKAYDVNCDDPRLEQYIRLYFPKLQQHLKEKGWLDIFAHHIADEPEPENFESWAAIAAMIKDAAPQMKLVEACPEHIKGMDIAVPLLGQSIETFDNRDYERWMYVCVVPQQNFANRFIQQPLLKPRLLQWICFRYGATGFLHWGLDYWRETPDPLHDCTPTNSKFPCGDSFVLYPDGAKVHPSMRFFAHRDGEFDYELLKLVDAHDGNVARKFAQEMILGPDEYNMDLSHFHELRRRILEYLQIVENENTLSSSSAADRRVPQQNGSHRD